MPGQRHWIGFSTSLALAFMIARAFGKNIEDVFQFGSPVT
jgi:DNA-binding XRE family transcriptional regulator